MKLLEDALSLNHAVETGHDRFGTEDRLGSHHDCPQLCFGIAIGDAVKGRPDLAMEWLADLVLIAMTGEAVTKLAALEPLAAFGRVADRTGQRCRDL